MVYWRYGFYKLLKTKKKLIKNGFRHWSVSYSQKKIIFISPAGNKVNYEEADTRIVLHASKVDSDVIVVCKDLFQSWT